MKPNEPEKTINLSSALIVFFVMGILSFGMFGVIASEIKDLRIGYGTQKEKLELQSLEMRDLKRTTHELSELDLDFLAFSEQVEVQSRLTSEKITIIEESLSPANVRWAKIKKIRTAVKESISKFRYRNKLGSVGVTTYASAVVDYSEKFDVPIALILSMTRRESAFNPGAYSSAGAVGLMQVMPSTAREIASDLGYRHYSLYKIRDNVMFGVYYIMKMLDEFEKYKDKVSLAVKAYNCGPTYTKKVIAGEYKDYPSENREYELKILGSEVEDGFIHYYQNLGL